MTLERAWFANCALVGFLNTTTDPCYNASRRQAHRIPGIANLHSSDRDRAKRREAPMIEPGEDIQRRRPVWEALSELFLDTELQEYDFARVSRVLAESGYTNEELHSILFREVFPACVPNLHHPAGAWTGFNTNWLEEEILNKAPCGQTDGLVPPPDYWMIEKEWRRVLELLPGTR